jgi:hypothetical protein
MQFFEGIGMWPKTGAGSGDEAHEPTDLLGSGRARADVDEVCFYASTSL